MEINVQFSDESQTKIVAFFGFPQDEDVYPNQAQIDSKDPRYAAYFKSLPASMQIALPNLG